jgi:hypothetical protein
VVAEALSGHMTKREISMLRGEVILLGARFRVVENSLPLGAPECSFPSSRVRKRG